MQTLAQILGLPETLGARVPSRLIPNSPIFFVGEAPGAQEEEEGRPFAGAAGRELRSMCNAVGIDLDSCSIGNVFSIRPPSNDVLFFFDGEHGDTPFPSLERGRYLNKKWMEEIDRLKAEIASVRPNVIVALGRTPLLALQSLSGIGANRGVVGFSTLLPGIKTLATYHPAAILRQWSLRIIALADLQKAARESASAELSHDVSTIWINPTLADLHVFEAKWMGNSPLISADIETDMARGLIRCVGFAPSEHIAISVPFTKNGGHYWRTPEEEAAAWYWVRHVLEDYKILFQNGGFDSIWLIYGGCPPKGYCEDTMLLHHALYPELKKDLGFMGSIYANRPAWKQMRPRGKSGKRDE